MQKAIAQKILLIVIPGVAGVLGTWLLTAYPAVHAAFCQVTP